MLVFPVKTGIFLQGRLQFRITQGVLVKFLLKGFEFVTSVVSCKIIDASLTWHWRMSSI